MSEETIILEIRKRGEEKANKILEDANKRAEEILDNAKNKANKLIVERVRTRTTELRRKILDNAELKGRFEILKTKNEVINKVLNMLMDELKAIASGNSDIKYESILYNLIKEGIKNIGENKVILFTNKKDREILAKNLDSLKRKIKEELDKDIDITLSTKCLDIIGGVVVKNFDETMEYRNTLEGRVKSMERKIKEDIWKKIKSEVYESR